VAAHGLSRDEFEAQWRATTLYDWNTTLAYAAYLGASGDTTRLLQFGNTPPPGSFVPTESDESATPSGEPRRTFAAYVLGPRGAGKVC